MNTIFTKITAALKKAGKKRLIIAALSVFLGGAAAFNTDVGIAIVADILLELGKDE